ncbi:hypothetical protein HN446_04590 [bacterium]|nr:hypothetical protein [bacterium]
MHKMYGVYYQAMVTRSECGFCVAILRSLGHVVFARTLDKEKSLFEFFLTEGTEPEFVDVAKWLEENGVLSCIKKMDNRLSFAGQEV